MRIAIFGVGALGCLFGARLSPHSEVTLVGRWPEQIAALRRGPLHITEAQGGEWDVWLRATDDVSAAGPADVALILTKTPKTEAAAQGAARALAPDGLAITLQNGLGNLEVLARHVGPERAALGVTTQGAALAGPGRLAAAGGGPTMLATQPAVDERVRRFAALCARAGVDVRVADDVDALLWGKLAVSAAINPLTALLRVPNGALLESPWARELLHQVAGEVAAVAGARGIRLPYDDAGAQAEQVARQTAPNHSSMLQDVLRGAESEIEAINGAVVRAADSAGVDVPANRLLYALVKALDETALARCREGQ
ncbi:MAG: 2-dehydropantoate 2-reductase [Chloroflexota bacterium]